MKENINATLQFMMSQCKHPYEQNACKGQKQVPKKLKFFIRIYTVQDVKKLNF